jgi:MFS family permease
MSIGIGAGGFAMAPLIGGYLIPNFGWETAYLTLALLTWVLVIPLALLLTRTKPADIGLHPDGIDPSDALPVKKTVPSVSEDLNLRMASGTLAFWLIGISFLLICFSQVGVIQSQVPHLEDIGFPIATAAGALGGVSLMSGLGKFFFGWLCDRMPAKYACLIGIGLQAAGVAILTNVRTTSPLVIIWLYAIFMGLGMGSWLPTMSMLTSTSFGLASYGAIFGMLTFTQNIGVATGPLMAGYMYDTMNTYHWAFIIFLSLYAVATFAIWGIRRPRLPE